MGNIVINSECLSDTVFQTNIGKLVWFCLIREMRRGNTSIISLSAIAGEIGVDEETVCKTLSALSHRGLIEIVNQYCDPSTSRSQGILITLKNAAVFKGEAIVDDNRRSETKPRSVSPSDHLSECLHDIKQKANPAYEGESPEWFKNYFNTVVAGTTIPKVLKMTDTRTKALRSRLKEYGIETVETVIQKVIDSDFLSKKWGKASFDWIFKKSNFLKILEGNYDDNTKQYSAQDRFSARRGTDVGNHSEADYGGPF